MKKLFIAALMIVAFGVSAMAASPIPVTTKVLNHFSTAFASATNVQWKTGNTFVKAAFTQDGQQWEAFYDVDGELFGTSRNVTLKELPAKGATYLAKKYPAYAIREVIEFNNEKEGLVYYASLVNNGVKLIMQVSTEGEVFVFKKTKA